MTSPKSKYAYPDLDGHKILYKGKRFWVFQVSSELPFKGIEKFCQVIVYDKKYGCEIAGAKNSPDGYSGSLIGPQDSVEISGGSPIELVDSVIHSSRNYEKHFAGYISSSTPRVRKRIKK
jgi:hypothetical protein